MIHGIYAHKKIHELYIKVTMYMVGYLVGAFTFQFTTSKYSLALLSFIKIINTVNCEYRLTNLLFYFSVL